MDLKKDEAFRAALVYKQLVANPKLIQTPRGKDLLRRSVEGMKLDPDTYDAATGQEIKKSIVRGISGRIYEVDLDGTVDMSRPDWFDHLSRLSK